MERRTETDAEELVGLFAAYDLEVQRREPVQHLIRFGNGRTFIDLWYGRRGFVCGVYNPRSQKVQFHRNVGHIEIENLIINATKL